jgi:hypothetical protein
VPKTVRAGEPFDLEIEWINRAAGRALRDFELRVRLTTETGNPLAAAEFGPLPTSEWLQNEKHSTQTHATFPKIAAQGGKAKLHVALHDPLTKRTIQLPLVKRSHDEFCEIAEVTVASD